MSEKLGRVPNCIDNLARDPSSSLSIRSLRKFIQERGVARKKKGRRVVGWWTIGRPLFSRVEFNFIENRTSMLRGKNERTFCSTSTSRRRRRTVGGVTSWWIWWDESLLVGPRGAIAVEGDAAWCVSSENIAKNRSWPRLLRRKLKIQRVEGNFGGWKGERGTRRKARRRRRR